MPLTTDRASAALERLIDPVRPDEFMRDYWEQRPLHVARAAPHWFEGFPAVGDIDSLVSHADPHDVRIVRTGHGVGLETEMAPGRAGGSTSSRPIGPTATAGRWSSTPCTTRRRRSDDWPRTPSKPSPTKWV